MNLLRCRHLAYLVLNLAAAALMVSAAKAAAADATLNAALEWSQIYKPDAWQPLRMQCRNNTASAIDGEVELPVGGGTSAALMKLPLTVPAHSEVNATLLGYFRRDTTEKQRKQGQSPPLALAVWRARDGTLLSRSEMLGAALGEEGETGEVVLIVNQRSEDLSEVYDAQSLLSFVKKSSGIPIAVAAIGPDALPRDSSTLRTLKAVILEGLDPDSLDQGQREALLEYARGGGTIVLAAPVIETQRAGNRLSSLLPVTLIGTREASAIAGPAESSSIKFRQPVEIVEAIAGDGDVLLGNVSYVDVAEKRIGLGKIVFTSFPINALDEKQPQVAMLWERLLGLKGSSRQVADSQLAVARHAVLGSMIGRKVAPWGVAGALAGGYVLAILLAQGLFLGPSRPKAAVVSGAAALLLTGTLLAMSVARHGDDALQLARLDVLDVSADGGGLRQESAAFIGVEDLSLALQASGDHVTIRPALVDASRPPLIRQQPFTVDNAGVYSQRIERVWEAVAKIDPKFTLDATARVDEHGLSLHVNNRLGKILESPLLIAQLRALSMKDAAVGQSDFGKLELNARGDFVNSSVLTSEHAARRGAVVKAALLPLSEASTQQRDELPLLLGWITEDATSALVRPSRDVAEPRSMVLVRTPVRLEPAKVGAKVVIPPALVQIEPGQLLYDLRERQTVPSQQTGQWLVRFVPPRQIGQLRTAHAMLELRVALPAHKLSISKGQAAGGKPTNNRLAAPIATWSKEVGLKQVAFDCDQNDIDPDGGVWLLFDVAPAAESGASNISWQIKEMSVTLEGEIIAAPRSVTLDPPTRPMNVTQ